MEQPVAEQPVVAVPPRNNEGVNRYPDDFFFFEYYDFNPWRMHRREKSRSAERREDEAMNKFQQVRAKVQKAKIENSLRIIELGTKTESSSPFRSLPAVSVTHILEFVRTKEEDPNTTAPAPVARGRSRARAAAAAKPDDSKEEAPLDMESLYTPGKQIVIPLTKPNCHLTGPSWRDFSRFIRQCDDGCWDVKRVAATPEEKKQYRETRKGKVYFINAVYTVPGGAPKKKRASKKTSDAKKPAAKKAKTEQEEE